MARKEKEDSGGGGGGGWIVTFSDLMTLLLTFFVLLLSMASMDERNVKEAVGSVVQKFTIGTDYDAPASRDAGPHSGEPGVMDVKEDDMSPLREMVFDDTTKDLNFQENKYVQVFSIQSEVLFPPGGIELSAEGAALLNRLIPYIIRLEYPLLIAGHTSSPYNETGAGYQPGENNFEQEMTWLISYRRALAVYRHFTDRGVDKGKLTIESFGQFRPKYSPNTAEGQRRNRRVDLVLDKRNKDWIEKVERLGNDSPQRDGYYYFNDFEFDLRMPGEPAKPGAGGKH